MQVGIKFTISFIWLLGYLVEILQWERGRDRKHPWSTTQHLEHIRKYRKNVLETPTSGFITSLLVTLTGHVTFGHVTPGGHVGYAQRHILYYYYNKKKAREKSTGVRTRSLPVTWLPVPITWLPVTSFPVRTACGDANPPRSSSNVALTVLKYYYCLYLYLCGRISFALF
jgi:hypothetical protein